MVINSDNQNGLERIMSDVMIAFSNPQRRTMHYDPNVRGFMDGTNATLQPRCGQAEWIIVTNMIAAVNCGKCLQFMTNDGMTV
jgi:hypothetical protein